MTTAPDHPAELGGARRLVALLSAEKAPRPRAPARRGRTGRGPLGARAALAPGLARRGRHDGRPGARRIADSLALMRSDRAILEVPRLDGIPVKTEESREVSGRIARIVFERVGPERGLGEAELNAAIAMFAADVALVRRDAVDSGVLERSADGAWYRLAG
ncbi:DUF2087 domain-containing protein [Brachybacterium sp. GPGPB12]|uniref:DUF2087 domain-containing protein n=1 Tax=Brachybacterium sp. GPGPB12 TaxID=3023517 RepID=UPI0031344BA4